MKRVMILMSSYTGHGHKSICDSLVEQFQDYPDVEVEVVEGFGLIGQAGINASKMYGPMTRKAQDLWKLTYLLSYQTAGVIADIMETLIHDRFMKKLMFFQPDLIITVHSLFNGSVLNLLEHYHIDIPMVTLQADIIDIHPTWCDPRALVTLCPTREALEASVRLGMPRSKLKLVGFPTRARFCEAARQAEHPDYDGSRPLQCLLMSGGEGSGNLKKYALELLNHFDCEVSVICGRNQRLKRALEDELVAQYGKRARIYGFCENVQDYMIASDLVIARGSPNTLMEAVVCNAPIVITGALPGQEAENPSLMANHDLGIICPSIKMLAPLVRDLLADDAMRLKEIRAAQRAYRNLDNAKNIARYLYSITEHKQREIPQFKLKFPAAMHAKYAMRVARRPFNRLYRSGKRD